MKLGRLLEHQRDALAYENAVRAHSKTKPQGLVTAELANYFHSHADLTLLCAQDSSLTQEQKERFKEEAAVYRRRATRLNNSQFNN